MATSLFVLLVLVAIWFGIRIDQGTHLIAGFTDGRDHEA